MDDKTDHWDEFVAYVNKVLDESAKRCTTKN